MKKLQKRWLALLLALTMLIGVLAGCGQTAAPASSASSSEQAASSEASPASEAASKPEAAAETGTRTFTDSLGREVEVSADLQRIAPSGTLAQIIAYTIAPERMVGWSSNPTDDMKKYFDAKYTDLPTFGAFYGKNADLNVEALIAADPQVVVDMGEIKGGKEKMQSDLDGLQKQLGIPVVFIETKLETSGDAYTMLGDLLNLPDQAKALADYCNTTITEAKQKAASIPEDKRVRLYYGEGKTGLQTNPVGSFHCEVLDIVGAVNVADIPKTSGAGGDQISMEQLLLWAPDAIILGPDSIYATIGEDPLWKDLSAIQQKKYYEIPSGPYNWVDRPPAINRILGIKWLGNLLYPEQFSYNMTQEAKTFYKLFYHYDLTDDEAKALMANSTFAAA